MAVERFCDCAPLDSPSHCREAVDKAYASWARLAELELASVTGHTVPLGMRASKPNLVRRTFRNKGPARAWASLGEARGLGWIVGMAQELESLGRGRADMAKVRNLCSCIVSNPPPWLSDLGHVGAWLRWLQGLASEVLGGRGMPLGFHEDLAQLDHELGLAKSCDLSSRAKQWSDWARSALEGSAGKAHRFTRVPEAWVPTVAMGHDGKPSAAPAAPLQEQRAMWGGLWQGGKGGDTRGSFTWPADAPCQSLPLLSADDLRRTSTAFSLRTASAPDGFHVRHFGLLSDQALGTLAQLLRLIEATGMWPSQVSQLIVALLAKPSGGFRPIGVFPGIYRLWMKSRGGLCMQWESSHELDCFAMGKHRSPLDFIHSI